MMFRTYIPCITYYISYIYRAGHHLIHLIYIFSWTAPISSHTYIYMSINIVSRAKHIQEAKKAAQQRLSQSDFDLSTLDIKSLFMRMSLLTYGLVQHGKSSSYYRFANLFRQRGMCHRSKAALQESTNNKQQLLELQQQLSTLLHTVNHILDSMPDTETLT